MEQLKMNYAQISAITNVMLNDLNIENMKKRRKVFDHIMATWPENEQDLIQTIRDYVKAMGY